MSRPETVAAATERAVIHAIERGIPLEPHPYRGIARRLGIDESVLLSVLRRLVDDGRIKRYGVVVRHRELGYTANGMVVWDVPEASLEVVGKRFAEMPFVTLCYQRPRRLPEWRYNLFTMVHGRHRSEVMNNVARLEALTGEDSLVHEVLFSTRQFKQRGARYSGFQEEDTGVTDPSVSGGHPT